MVYYSFVCKLRPIKQPIFLYYICFHSDDHDFSHDAGRYLRSVSSEVAEETNQSTKVSAQVKHMMSAEVDEVMHD